MKKLATTIILLSALSAPVMAGNYAGVQYAMVTYEESGIPDFNPSAIVGIFGHEFNNNFAIEGRLGAGLGDDSNNISGVDVAVEVNNFVSIFAKGSIPMGASVKAYGLIGYTNGKITASAGGFSASASESDVSYGFGLEFGGSKTVGTLEYVNYIDKNGGSLSSINLGANFKF